MLVAVNYHYIREGFCESYPSIFGVTPEQFSRQLDIMGKSALFLAIDDIVDIIEGRRSFPRRAAVITFDDGLKEQFEFAWPILQKKGIPAIFFVNTKPIEEDFVTVTHKIHILRARTPPDKLLAILKQILSRENIAFELPDSAIARSIYKFDSAEAAKLKYFLNYVLNENQQKLVIDRSFNILGFDQARMSNDLYMTKDMIVKLALTGALGTHGHAHRPLGLLEKNIAIADFDISINKLKEWTGKDMLAFSYPFGFYEACSKAVADYAMNNHIKFAFTLERAGNKKLDTPMFLGRFSPNDIFIGNTSYCPITFWNGLTDTVWFK